MTDTWGTTPCRATFWKKIRPQPPSAAAPSCSRAPADSRNATSGAPAVPVLKRVKWPSNDAQNLVAKWIAGEHMDPAKAAQKWVQANMKTVNKWLGKK